MPQHSLVAPPYGGRLPPELIDYIIAYLYMDNPALLRCSLVCRRWLHASRRCSDQSLFEDIDLSFEAWQGFEPLEDDNGSSAVPKATRRTASFFALLESPHCTLKPYIHYFCCGNLSAPSDPHFPSLVFQRLSVFHVKTFYIAHTVFSDSSVDALISAFPRLSCLELDQINFAGDLLGVIRRIPSLNDLTLYNTKWNAAPGASAALTHLQTDSKMLQRLLTILSAYPAGHLQVKSIDVLLVDDPEGFKTIGRHLHLLPDLCTLGFRFTPDKDRAGEDSVRLIAFTTSIDISVLPALREFCISGFDPLTMLPALLRTGSDTLEMLVVDSSGNIADTMTDAVWAAIAVALSADAFPSLDTFEICVDMCVPASDEELEDRLDAAYAALAELDHRMAVHVEIDADVTQQ